MWNAIVHRVCVHVCVCTMRMPLLEFQLKKKKKCIDFLPFTQLCAANVSRFQMKMQTKQNHNNDTPHHRVMRRRIKYILY